MRVWRESCGELRLIFNETELFNAATEMALSLGFETFLFGLSVPTSIQRPMLRFYGPAQLPAGWEEKYPQGELPQLDLIIGGARPYDMGVNWDDPGTKRNADFWRAVLPGGEVHGWSQPTHGAGLAQGMASFIRRTLPVTEAELEEIEFKIIALAQALHSQIMEILIESNTLYDPLTEQETAVLRWAAEGKTALETGKILNTPVRTITHLRTRCIFKMRAINLAQAAVRAQGFGLLQNASRPRLRRGGRASNELSAIDRSTGKSRIVHGRPRPA